MTSFTRKKYKLFIFFFVVFHNCQILKPLFELRFRIVAITLIITCFVFVSEVEFLNPLGAPSLASSQPMSPVSIAPPSNAAPGSGIQRLLTTMTQRALSLRQYYNINSPLPPMEEPCPCDAECCSLPMEPRRLIPVMNVPMTAHQGCCGCVDCPYSLSPMVTSLLQASAMMSTQQRSMATPPIDAKR